MISAVVDEELQPPKVESSTSPSPPARTTSRTVLWLVLIAFLVRLGFLLILQTYRPGRIDDYTIGGETTNIALTIARGQGFSNAMNGLPSGPTAWLAPVYPYLVALVFRFLGVMSVSSVIFIFAMQGLISALTVIPIVGIAEHTTGRTAGLWAARIWAIFPWFCKWSVTWIWDTSLSALLLAFLFWYAAAWPETANQKAKTWIGFGALWGFALLVNPSLGAFLPVALAWCAYELHRRREKWLKPVALSLAVCTVVVLPWLARNRAVFGQWVFLRSNFGFEFALGNYRGSLGRGWGAHPSGDMEFPKYQKMGEIAYVRWREREALQWVEENPRDFIALTAKRVSYFWDGSSMHYRTRIPWYWAPASYVLISFLLLPALLIARRRRLLAWPMFLGLLLLYPVPYYLTFTQARYRHPIEPIMILLIAYAGVESLRSLRAPRSC